MLDVFGSPALDRLGTLAEGARSAGSLNRPRVLPPSFGSWTKVKAAVVANSAATWKATWAGYGIDVVWDPETQRLAMLYGGYDGTYTKTGLAYSDDGIKWTDYGSNPVFSVNGTAGQIDSGGVVYLQPVYEAGTWYGYYIGFPNTGIEQGTPTICLATATSLKGPWTRQGAKITTSSFPSGLGGETVTVMYRPTVLKVGATWHMFINGGPAPGNEDIWHFTAPAVDGPWAVDARVIVAESFGATSIISDPEVVRWGDMFVLIGWTSGFAGSGLALAYSREDEFPTTWHAQSTAFLAVTPGLYRPCLVTLPDGSPALYVHASSNTGFHDGAQVDLYVPKTAVPVGAQPSIWGRSILCTMPPFASSGTWNANWSNPSSGQFFANINLQNTSHANGNSITWVTDLSAGTWSLRVTYGKFSIAGTFVVELSWDNGSTFTTVGTVDSYNVSATAVVGTSLFTGIDVPQSGPVQLRARVTGKNASSTDFYVGLSTFDFQRTA